MSRKSLSLYCEGSFSRINLKTVRKRRILTLLFEKGISWSILQQHETEDEKVRLIYHSLGWDGKIIDKEHSC